MSELRSPLRERSSYTFLSGGASFKFLSGGASFKRWRFFIEIETGKEIKGI
jgi:hypothetical protein